MNNILVFLLLINNEKWFEIYEIGEWGLQTINWEKLKNKQILNKVWINISRLLITWSLPLLQQKIKNSRSKKKFNE